MEENFEEMLMDTSNTSAIEDIQEKDYSDTPAGQIVNFVKLHKIIVFHEISLKVTFLLSYF